MKISVQDLNDYGACSNVFDALETLGIAFADPDDDPDWNPDGYDTWDDVAFENNCDLEAELQDVLPRLAASNEHWSNLNWLISTFDEFWYLLWVQQHVVNLFPGDEQWEAFVTDPTDRSPFTLALRDAPYDSVDTDFREYTHKDMARNFINNRRIHNRTMWDMHFLFSGLLHPHFDQEPLAALLNAWIERLNAADEAGIELQKLADWERWGEEPKSLQEKWLLLLREELVLKHVRELCEDMIQSMSDDDLCEWPTIERWVRETAGGMNIDGVGFEPSGVRDELHADMHRVLWNIFYRID